MSEIESRLDERAINRILMMPLTYLVAIAILLSGVVVGVWGHRLKVRKAQGPRDEQDENET